MKKVSWLKASVLAVCLVAAATGTWAREKATAIAVGTPVQFRAHSSTHEIAKVHRMQMLYAPGLEDNCSSVYLYSDADVVLYATLLKAVTSRSVYTLIYSIETDTRGPWGDPQSCMLTSVTIHQ
ncbi:hypothetical protein [Roseateles sp. MS654]|uniref:hypothetical protein n=1 Tax=Roseateles sp. MS654 TaxID=3412685 RepID=UPI003C2EA6C3